MKQMFCDGGVIGHNPSEIGGTWAYRIVEDGEVIREKSGTITPRQAKMPLITNNLTEMCALVAGLKVLPDDWTGTVYSDSQITLGRAFQGWKWNNIPDWLYRMFGEQRDRLKNWDRIEFVLLEGHPTKAELILGVGRKGYPVSEHNVAVDRLCNAAAENYLSRKIK